jgi:hypothetical protein
MEIMRDDRQLVDAFLCRTIERELTAARAEMPWYANGESKEEWMERQCEKYQHLENTIKEVTEQRDRLAKALRNCLPFITGDGCGEYSDAREAIQSLTTNVSDQGSAPSTNSAEERNLSNE